MKDNLSEKDQEPRLTPEELSLVNEIVGSTSFNLMKEEDRKKIVERCSFQFKAERGLLSIISEEKDTRGTSSITRMLRSRDPSIPFWLEVTLTGWITKYQSPLLVNNASTDDRFKGIEWEGLVIRSVLVVPMKAENRTIGFIALFNKKEQTFTRDDQRILTGIANMLAQSHIKCVVMSRSTLGVTRAGGPDALLKLGRTIEEGSTATKARHMPLAKPKVLSPIVITAVVFIAIVLASPFFLLSRSPDLGTGSALLPFIIIVSLIAIVLAALMMIIFAAKPKLIPLFNRARIFRSREKGENSVLFEEKRPAGKHEVLDSNTQELVKDGLKEILDKVEGPAFSEDELNEAIEQWRYFVPKETPKLVNFEVAGTIFPSKLFPGDYFDYLRIGDGQWCFVLADVAGKGLPASILTYYLQAAIHGQIAVTSSCSRCMTNASHMLKRFLPPGRFVTLFLSTIDDNDKTLMYCNGGHNPPYLFGADGIVRRLDKGGPILGTPYPASYEEEKVQVSSGDVLVIYSDGVTEAFNEKGEQFGEERFLGTLRPVLSRSASDILSSVTFSIGKFYGNAPISDDLTLMVIKAL